jgi:nucleotide-binding universal stress UspA family protein
MAAHPRRVSIRKEEAAPSFHGQVHAIQLTSFNSVMFMIRDVLVHVDASLAGQQRLEYAFDLADRHGARLTAAHVLAPVDVPPYFRPSAIEREASILEREARRDAAAAERLFDARSAARGTPARWRSLEGDMKGLLCSQAACSDLVILGQYEAEGTPERHPLYLAEEVVLGSGRPVLVLPDRVDDTVRMRRALIGWDGSREAARSVHDAIPLLSRAGAQVEVLVADEHGKSVPIGELVDHLGRHGVAVDPERHVHSRAPAGDALLERLSAREFDLLVMGAYGRPVWLEYVFGGATRAALMRAPTPVLVSH